MLLLNQLCKNYKSDKNSANPSPSITPLSPSSLNFFENFFRGLYFKARYKTSIVQKPFVYEKTIDMYFYQNSPLHKLFDNCGIASMVFPPYVAYPKLIQQFYTNLEYTSDSYTIFVKGKSFKFTMKDLGTILSIPSTGICSFTLKGAAYEPFQPLEQLQIVKDDPTIKVFSLPKTIDVSPLACVIHKVLRYNLLPRTGGGINFTYQDLVLSAMILKLLLNDDAKYG